jgi:decaprenyl-phosphate phosphoribosyltransferase
MTANEIVTSTDEQQPTAGALPAQGQAISAAAWLFAAVRETRPRQWPKNLLVFAAPLAAGSLGSHYGLYALFAAVSFLCASAAVYIINDTMDVERDRRHPVKRHRPIASGALPVRHAVVLAAAATVVAAGVGLVIGAPLLTAAAVAYLCLQFLYSVRLKHVPYVEMVLVASGFLLRVLGGAAATRVPVSVWFLLVCSLGALGVAVAKRYTELTSLGGEAARHRPVMRWYSAHVLRVAQIVVGAGMIATYLTWAWGESDGTRLWHVVSAVPLLLALVRFGMLTGHKSVRQVEDMIMRDGPMVACEVVWLGLFCVGLYAGS